MERVTLRGRPDARARGRLRETRAGSRNRNRSEPIQSPATAKRKEIEKLLTKIYNDVDDSDKDELRSVNGRKNLRANARGEARMPTSDPDGVRECLAGTRGGSRGALGGEVRGEQDGELAGAAGRRGREARVHRMRKHWRSTGVYRSARRWRRWL